jgi:hypothetical protein
MVKSEEKWQREGDSTGSWSRKTLANLVTLSELSNKKPCIANMEIQVPLSKQSDIDQLEADPNTFRMTYKRYLLCMSLWMLIIWRRTLNSQRC